MTSYKTEFSYFESEPPAVFLAAPWTDVSWHNEAAPCFAWTLANGRAINVYVDEADPAKRENGPECERFAIRTTDASGAFDSEGFASNDLAATLAHVEQLARLIAA